MDESSIGHSPNQKRSDYSLDSSSTITASPASPIQHRPGYHRITSLNEVDTSYSRAEVDTSEKDDQLESSSSIGIARKGLGQSSQRRGLGIGNVDTQRPQSMSRVPLGSKSTPSPPPSADPLLSPSITRGGRGSQGMQMQFDDAETDHSSHGRNGSKSSVFEPFTAGSDHERLRGMTPSTAEIPPSGTIIQLIIFR